MKGKDEKDEKDETDMFIFQHSLSLPLTFICILFQFLLFIIFLSSRSPHLLILFARIPQPYSSYFCNHNATF